MLETGVKFYAALGNHDQQTNRSYAPFNMDDQRYYSYARRNVRFFVLDSNYFDPAQQAWVEASLKAATEEWKICYFHHPLYSDGRTHGSEVELRLQPIDFILHTPGGLALAAEQIAHALIEHPGQSTVFVPHYR